MGYISVSKIWVIDPLSPSGVDSRPGALKLCHNGVKGSWFKKNETNHNNKLAFH